MAWETCSYCPQRINGYYAMGRHKRAAHPDLPAAQAGMKEAYNHLMGNYERANEMIDRVIAARWVAEAALVKAADTIGAALEIMKTLAQAHGAEYWITPEMEEQWEQIENTLVEIRRMTASAKSAAGEEVQKKSRSSPSQ